jgi:hypothetical protein
MKQVDVVLGGEVVVTGTGAARNPSCGQIAAHMGFEPRLFSVLSPRSTCLRLRYASTNPYVSYCPASPHCDVDY